MRAEVRDGCGLVLSDHRHDAACAASRKIAETLISGVFWIRPLVGVHGCPSRVKDPR
jgi:hypothetical protein